MKRKQTGSAIELVKIIAKEVLQMKEGKNRKYRICKSEGDWYKIQRWRNPIKVLGHTLRKEKWVDGCFTYDTDLEGLPVSSLTLFKTKEEAEQKIQEFQQNRIRLSKRKDNKWFCAGEIY